MTVTQHETLKRASADPAAPIRGDGGVINSLVQHGWACRTVVGHVFVTADGLAAMDACRLNPRSRPSSMQDAVFAAYLRTRGE